jgi:hypothetical protein
MTESRSTRGFRHHHTDEELRRWAAVPAAKKLEWLEEVNEFLHSAMSPEAKLAARRFRRGEI